MSVPLGFLSKRLYMALLPEETISGVEAKKSRLNGSADADPKMPLTSGQLLILVNKLYHHGIGNFFMGKGFNLENPQVIHDVIYHKLLGTPHPDATGCDLTLLGTLVEKMVAEKIKKIADCLALPIDPIEELIETRQDKLVYTEVLLSAICRYLGVHKDLDENGNILDSSIKKKLNYPVIRLIEELKKYINRNSFFIKELQAALQQFTARLFQSVIMRWFFEISDLNDFEEELTELTTVYEVDNLDYFSTNFLSQQLSDFISCCYAHILQEKIPSIEILKRLLLVLKACDGVNARNSARIVEEDVIFTNLITIPQDNNVLQKLERIYATSTDYDLLYVLEPLMTFFFPFFVPREGDISILLAGNERILLNLKESLAVKKHCIYFEAQHGFSQTQRALTEGNKAPVTAITHATCLNLLSFTKELFYSYLQFLLDPRTLQGLNLKQLIDLSFIVDALSPQLFERTLELLYDGMIEPTKQGVYDFLHFQDHLNLSSRSLELWISMRDKIIGIFLRNNRKNQEVLEATLHGIMVFSRNCPKDRVWMCPQTFYMPTDTNQVAYCMNQLPMLKKIVTPKDLSEKTLFTDKKYPHLVELDFNKSLMYSIDDISHKNLRVLQKICFVGTFMDLVKNLKNLITRNPALREINFWIDGRLLDQFFINDSDHVDYVDHVDNVRIGELKRLEDAFKDDKSSVEVKHIPSNGMFSFRRKENGAS